MLCWTTMENERAMKESQGSVRHLTQFAAMIGVWGAFIAFIISVMPLDSTAGSCRIERQCTIQGQITNVSSQRRRETAPAITPRNPLLTVASLALTA